MCGIFGRLTPGRPVDVAACCRATQTLAHRGPDGLGVAVGCFGGRTPRFFLNPPAELLCRESPQRSDLFLGHRRLSIIDLAPEAFQPMANEDGAVWVVFNGEIYNHESLRELLVRSGHRFATDHSDTEILVHGYEEWGPRLVDRLRGMFAWAILDLRANRLLLARDRFGEKPLYYWTDASGVAFASELKALLALDELDRTLCDHALVDYLHHGFVPAPRSILKNVRKVCAAELVTIQLDRPDVIRAQTYWSMRYEPEPGKPGEQWVEEFQAKVRESVRLRMLSDVPLGAFLSGGLDSTLVVREASRVAGQPVETFSIGFAESRFDESRYAEQAARQYGTAHHLRMVSPRDLLEVVPVIAQTFDEPMADSSAVPTYLVSRLAREHVTVALSGDGGDELLAGYPRYVTHHWLERALRWQPARALAGLLRPLATAWPESLKGKGLLRLLIPRSDARYVETFLDRYLVGLARPGLSDGWECLLESARPDRAAEPVDQWCAADCRFYIPEDLMVKVDRTSMRASLEARAPLLDHELFELVGRMPLGVRFDGRSGKLPVRAILAREMGRAFVDRPKKGFSVPLGQWFRQELREHLRDAILRRGGLLDTLFPRRQIERLLQMHLTGSRDLSPRLWRLFMLENWHERYGQPRAVQPTRPAALPRAA